MSKPNSFGDDLGVGSPLQFKVEPFRKKVMFRRIGSYAELIRMDTKFSAAIDDSVHIHLVEDDADDVYLLKRALSRHIAMFELHVHENGRVALDHLVASADQDIFPDLILLDINMPVMNGFEFLISMRQRVHFRVVPIVVITTANDPESIDRAYAYGANCVITKHKLFNSGGELVQLMADYWINLAERPTNVAPIEHANC